MSARFLMLWTVAVVATAASFVVHLTLRFETVRLGYDVGAARREQRHLLEARRLLSIEAATLGQPDRVEAVARGAFAMDQPRRPRIVTLWATSSAPRRCREGASEELPGPPRALHARCASPCLALLLLGGAVARRATQRVSCRSPRGRQLREMAEEQYLKDIRLSPKRGTIYDRNGAELAVSVDVDSVYANPSACSAAGRGRRGQRGRRSSSALLGRRSARPSSAALRADRHFAWIKRRVSPKRAKAVALARAPRRRADREARRYYPNRELAAHVLGFADIDGRASRARARA